MVQGVEPIRAELELKPLQMNCSGQHGIQVVLSVLTDSGEEAAQVPQMIA